MKKLNSWGCRIIAMFLLMLGFLPIQAKTVIFTADQNDTENTLFWETTSSNKESSFSAEGISLLVNYHSASLNSVNNKAYTFQNGSWFRVSLEKEDSYLQHIRFYVIGGVEGRLVSGETMLSWYPESDRKYFEWTADDTTVRDLTVTVNDVDGTRNLNIFTIEVTYGESEEPDDPVVPDPEYYSVTAESGHGGSVTFSGLNEDGKVAKGSEVAVSFTPDDGYELESVSVNGIDMTSSVAEGTLVLTVESDINIVATFSEKKYQVTFDENISVNVGEDMITSGVSLPHGTELTITVTAPEKKLIDSVTIADESQTISDKKVDTYTHKLTGDCEIVANFADEPAAPQEYTVRWETVEGATILVYNKDTLKQYESGNTIAEGTEIYVIAEESTGYVITSLMINDTEYTQHDSEKANQIKTGVFPVTNDLSISVEVQKVPSNYQVSWETDNNCKIAIRRTIDGDNEFSPLTVKEGESVFVTITPNDGYVLKNVEPSGLLSEDRTVENKELIISDNLVIKASAERIPEYKVGWSVNYESGATIDISAGETSLPNGSSVREGTVLRVSVTPTEGYILESVKINELDQTLNEGRLSSELTVKAAVDIEVSVKKKEYSLTVTGGENATVTVNGAAYSSSTTLAHGEEAEIKVKPSSGYKLVTLTLDGETTSVDGLSEKTLKIKPVKDVSLVIETAEIPSQGINWSVPENAEISATVNGKEITNGAQVQEGNELTIKITAKEGYELKLVKIGEDEYPLDDASTFETQITVAGRMSIVVEVKPKQYSLTVNSGNATVSINGNNYTEEMSVDYGTELTISAQANDGYNIKSVTINGESVSLPFTLTVKGNLSIKVETEAIAEYSVSWSVEDEAGATVEVSSANGKLESGSNVRSGSKITISVTPNDGYQIESVTINEENQQLSDGSFTSERIVESAVNIIVVAKKKTYALNVTGQDNATVTIDGKEINASTRLVHGKDTELKVKAKSGYRLSSITLDSEQIENVGGLSEKTINLTPTNDVSLIIVTSEIPSQGINWAVPENAEITVIYDGNALENGAELQEGSKVTVKVAAKTGYELEGIKIGDTTYTPENTALFEREVTVSGSMQIEVTVKAKQYNLTVNAENVTVTVNETTYTGEMSVKYGSQLIISANANDGYRIKMVTVNDDDATLPLTIMVESNIYVNIETEKIAEYELSWTINEPAGATLEATSSNKQIESGTSLRSGTKVNLGVKPTEGYQLEMITINGNIQQLEGGQLNIELIVEQNTIIDITVKRREYSLTLTGADNADVTVDDAEYDASTKFVHGIKRSINVKAKSGYRLQSLVLDGKSEDVAGLSEKTIEVLPVKDMILAIETAKIPEQGINWSVSENATVSVLYDGKEITNGSQIQEGSKVTVKITAKEGFEIEQVKIGNETFTPADKAAFEKEVTVNGSMLIEVTVKAKEYTLTVNSDNAEVKINDAPSSEIKSLSHGKKITVSITAAKGYVLESVSINGNAVEIVEKTAVTAEHEVSGDVAISVITKKIPVFSITWKADEGVNISVRQGEAVLSSGDSVEEGSTINVTATAAEGYIIESATIGGIQVAPDADGKIVKQTTVSSNIAISVSVKKKDYAVSVSGNDHAEVTIDAKKHEDGLKVVHGQKIEIAVKVNEGYELKKVTVNGKTYASEDSKTVNVIHTVTGNVKIEIESAEIPKRGVSWNTPEGSKVTVTANGKEITSGTELQNGTEITVNITPSEGYELTGVKIGGVDRELNDKTVFSETLKVEGTLRIEVTVRKKTYPLTITGENVTVKIGDETAGTDMKLEHGQEAEFLIIPAEGYELESISLNDKAETISNRKSHTIKHKVAGNIVITVKTRKETRHSVKWTAEEGVEIAVSQDGKALESGATVSHESSVRISVKPKEGYELKEVAVNGAVKELTDKSKFETELKVTAPVEIKASATLKTYKIDVKGGDHADVAVDGVAVSTDMKLTHGRNIAITVKAKDGYEIAGVELNGTVLPLGEAKSETTIMVRIEKDLTLSLTMRRKGRYQVKWNVPTGVEVTVTKPGGQQIASGDSIESGTEVKLRIVAKTGYRIGVVKIAGVAMNVATDTLFETSVKVTANTVIEIWTTQADKYPVVWSDCDGGKIEVRRADDGVALKSGDSVTKGTRIKVRVEPEKGCKTQTVLVNNKEQSLTTTTEATEFLITVETPTTINARFERPKCLVSVTVSDKLCGTARIAGYGPDEAVEFASGKLITLTAEPAEGCEFAGWLRDGTAIAGGASLSLTIDKSAKFEARFRSKVFDKHSVRFELSHPDHGKVRILHLEDQGLDLGVKHGQKFETTRRILAEAESTDPDTEFEKWTDGEGRVVGKEARAVYASHYDGILKACFVRMVALSYSCGEGGEMSVEDADGELILSGERVRDDVAVVLKMRPDNGFIVESVSVNGSELPADSLTTHSDGLVTAKIVAKEATTVSVKYVAHTDAIDSVSADPGQGEAIYYDLRGARVGSSLPTTPGIYIERRNGKSRKIRVSGR